MRSDAETDKWAQMSAKGRKRAQKGASASKLQTTRLEITRLGRSQKPKPCETKARLLFTLVPVGIVRDRSGKCLNERNWTLRCMRHRNVAIRVSKTPRCTRKIVSACACTASEKVLSFLLGALGSFFSGSTTVSMLTFTQVRSSLSACYQRDLLIFC